MTRMTTPAAVAGAIALLAIPLSACAPDRVVTGSTYPTDYHARHPIVLAHAPETLDLFVTARGLDER